MKAIVTFPNGRLMTYDNVVSVESVIGVKGEISGFVVELETSVHRCDFYHLTPNGQMPIMAKFQIVNESDVERVIDYNDNRGTKESPVIITRRK